MRNYKVQLRTKCRRLGFRLSRTSGVYELNWRKKRIYSGTAEEVELYLVKYQRALSHAIILDNRPTVSR